MADFISALTGQQMDLALMDMAEHNSEAWAVGARNGVPVQPGDATYENNSKYYADLASNVITGDVTKAVRWDVQQALTNPQKAQARTNIGAVDSSDVDTAVAAGAASAIQTALNRTTAVNVADTNYTTYMARGTSLNATETTPTVNGTIAWLYE